MTFREPAVLLGLALIPVALLAYWTMQRRRRREAAVFADPALMPNVVTRRPGWRRHAPALLVLLAAAALSSRSPGRSARSPRRSAPRPSCWSTTCRAPCAPRTSTPTA